LNQPLRDNLRVALVSIGIGRVQRGFERYFTDLYHLLRDDLDVTLFKSRGQRTKQEKVPPLLWPTTHLMRRLPMGQLAGSAEYNRDSIAYALTMLPQLRQGKFDVVHLIDPPMAYAVPKLRRLLPKRTALLFTEGCNMPVSMYPNVDHLHYVAQHARELALNEGIDPARTTLVPCGLHTNMFQSTRSRQELRQQHGIPDSTFVVLMVCAVRRLHKRVDHVLKEVAQLPGDVLFWIDGNPENDALISEIRQTMGDRCRITHVPSEQVPELYGLADVLVQASLDESFGLAIVEAMAAGTRVLVHDAPHFRWLVDDETLLVDMTAEGALREALAAVQKSGQEDKATIQARSNNIKARFDWANVKQDYISMYQHVAANCP
jgi:glycosyltransferase involved in cell wall biosynthesis